MKNYGYEDGEVGEKEKTWRRKRRGRRRGWGRGKKGRGSVSVWWEAKGSTDEREIKRCEGDKEERDGNREKNKRGEEEE